MNTRSFYLKLFSAIRNVTIITILVLYTLSLSIVFLNFRNENLKSAKHKINLLEQQIDYYANSLQYYSRSMSNNPVIQKSMISYNKNQFINAGKVNMSVEIGRVTLPIPYIYGASIYDREQNIVVSSETSPKALSFEKDTKGHWIYSQKKDYGDIIHNTISYIRPFYDYTSGEALGYIELSISDQSIADIYKIIGLDAEDYLILNDKKEKFSFSDPSMDGKMQTDILSKYRIGKITLSKDFFIYSENISSLNMDVIYVLPIQNLISKMVNLALFFLMILVILLFLSTLISKNLSKSILKPLYRIIDYIESIKESKEPHIFEYQTDISDMNLLIQTFNDMILSQNKLKEEISEIHFRLLNEQIKPHFLYNTLENISALASLDEKERLLEIIDNLSGFYRLVLGQGKAFISIFDELETIKAYMNIMNIRYMEKFDYEIQCDPKLYPYSCPKLILQPLVENAIYHGMKGIAYKGFLKIEISNKGNDIEFRIIDNGIGLKDADLKPSTKSFAIQHIRTLLHLYYGSAYNVELFNNQEQGCTAKFAIKKEKRFETEHNHSG